MKLTLGLAATLCVVMMTAAVAACYDRANGAQHRFVLNDGEAFDTKTGLSWKRCSLGTDWDGKRGCAGELSFASLDEAEQLAKAAGPQWRVPSGPELESIVDHNCGSPVVDKAVFPDISVTDEGTAQYWTTNAVGMADLFYVFDFVDGRPDGHSRGVHLAVRLVRTGK